jgi:nitroreductase
MKTILSRRSIRQFTGESIRKEDVLTFIEAAMVAPSACNQQPWHFVVAKDKETHRKVMEIHPYTKMLEKASHAIFVCADPGLQTCPGYWTQDLSAATENLLLAVHAMGYGATWCGVYPDDNRVWNIREILDLPKRVIPLNVVAIGVPDEEKPPSNRYKEERVHYEKW